MRDIISESRAKKHQVFTEEVRAAGYDVRHYEGRNSYSGPAVIVAQAGLQDVIRATSIRLTTDQMGKGSIVIYPA